MNAFNQSILPGVQRGERDDKFSQISERSVELATDRITRFGRDEFGGVTQESGQRDDGQDGQHKKQRVCFWLLSGEQHGHKGQQPEQRIVANLLKQGIHGGSPKERINSGTFCNGVRSW